MFCNKCGKEIQEGKKFCSGCGAPVSKPDKAVEAETSTPANVVAPAVPTPTPTPTPTPAPQVNPTTPAPVAPVVTKKAPITKKKNPKKLIGILGSVVVLAGLVTGGILIMKNIQAKRAEEVKKMLRRGDKYLEEMDFDEAISVYQEILEMDSRNEKAYLGLANAFMGNRDYYSALEVLNTASDKLGDDASRELDRLMDEVEDVVELETSLSGMVVIGDDDTIYGNNDSLVGVKVSIESIDLPEGYEYSDSVYTDENGYYEFEDLHLGLYSITYERDGYMSTSQSLEIYPGQEYANNQIVELISDDNSGEGYASGQIIDARTGYGVGDLTLEIREGYNNLDGNIVSTTTTDNSGYYMTEELDAGIYTLNMVGEAVDGTEYSGFINIKIFGDTTISNQNGAVSDGLTAGQIRVVLTWGEYPRDLDSHFFCHLNSNDNYHIYYGSKTFTLDGERIADLDLDDTTSYGPETTTLYDPRDGVYTFGVRNYSHNYNTDLSESGAIVQVYLSNANIPAYVYYVPQGEGYFWEIFSYDTTTNRITTINTIKDDCSTSDYWD